MLDRSVGLPISTVWRLVCVNFVVNRSITISAAPRLLPEIETEVLKRSSDAKKGLNLPCDSLWAKSPYKKNGFGAGCRNRTGGSNLEG